MPVTCHESTMRYDPENDIFFHKHEDESSSAYFCERHESLEEDEVRPYRGSFEPVGVAHSVTSHIEPRAADAWRGRHVERVEVPQYPR